MDAHILTITIILLINATNVRNKSRRTQKSKDTKIPDKKKNTMTNMEII